MLNEVSQGKFERNRIAHKSGIFSGCLVFFKSTVGLGLLVSQYFFGRAGLALGTLTTIFTCLIIGYTMQLIINVADRLERERGEDIENYDQITNIVYGKKMMVITKIFCFLFNEGIILVNITHLSGFFMDNLKDLLPESLHEIEFFKLMTILVILVILVVILEPEKIKYPSYVAGFILIVATALMWILSYVQLYKNTEKKHYDLFSFPDFPAVIGNQLYAFESIGTLFTVRSTLAKRNDMHKVLWLTFILIFTLFATNGITFLLVNLIDFRQKRFATCRF